MPAVTWKIIPWLRVILVARFKGFLCDVGPLMDMAMEEPYLINVGGIHAVAQCWRGHRFSLESWLQFRILSGLSKVVASLSRYKEGVL